MTLLYLNSPLGAHAHRRLLYLVTWNLRDTAIWECPKAGTPLSKDSSHKLRDYPDNYEVGAAEDQILSEITKIKIISRGSEILRDLERLLRDEALELVEIDATYFVGRLIEAVQQLIPKLTESLHHRLQAEIELRNQLVDWATKHSIPGAPTEEEFAKSLARQIIYRLLGKILFYQSLRRSARNLPKLDLQGTDTSQVIPTLRAAFKEALKIDYHAVFEEGPPDRIPWPAEASQILAILIGDFNTRDFANLPQDVVGTVFERLIPPEARHGLGQYFTPENLCDLIIAFCVCSPKDKVLDPTCGTGTFLIRAYDRIRWLGQHDHQALLSQIWGIDVAPFPAELATINLFRQRIGEYANFPRIVCQDFFKVKPGEKFPFPPPKVDMEHPEIIEEEIPQFDAIIGNFPYISGDQIERVDSKYLDFLRHCLIDGWLDDYPQLFYYKNSKEQQFFEKSISMGMQSRCAHEKLQHRLSTYADLYVYLFYQASRFLKPGGRIGIITSNAWLDINYGYELQKFFLEHYKIVSILESRCEPWFTEASVNTVVTILERCESSIERDANLVRFVKVKRSLAELIPEDIRIEALARWQNLTKLVTRIGRAGAKYLNVYPLGRITEEDEDFRIRILRQGELRTEVERKAKTVKWGQYLRAPEIYFDILEKGKFCLLGDLAIPKFGSKTRINEFFHITSEIASKFKIEEEYLWPLIKSPKDTKTVRVDPAELKLRLFVCRKNKAELKALGHYGALMYIEWGEKQTYSKGQFQGSPWPEGTWVKERKPGWWALPNTEINFGQLFFSEAFGDAHIHRYSPTPIIPDKRLYFLSPAPEVKSPMDLAAILNSSITSLLIEASGRVTLGDGVLEFSVEDARDYLKIPDFKKFDLNNMEKIANAFQSILIRPVNALYDEVKCPDRNSLDSEILTAMGLNPKQYLKPLYHSLCELVRERMNLGQLRHKSRKTRVRGEYAEKQAADIVLDEIIPDGPKRFPDDFFSAAAKSEPKTSIPLPKKLLVFNGVYVEDKTFRHQVKTAAEARYLIYAQKAGQDVAHLPQKTVELTRTVANYEKYLRDLRKTLYEAYFRRTFDNKIALRLTQAAFDKFRLPNPE